jgi:hypothetical protein
MGFLFPDRDAAADGHVKSPPFPRDAGDGLDVVKGAVRLQRSDQQAGRWPVFFPQHGPVSSQAIQAMNAADHRGRRIEKGKDRDQARRIVDVNAPAPVVDPVARGAIADVESRVEKGLAAPTKDWPLILLSTGSDTVLSLKGSASNSLFRCARSIGPRKSSRNAITNRANRPVDVTRNRPAIAK